MGHSQGVRQGPVGFMGEDAAILSWLRVDDTYPDPYGTWGGIWGMCRPGPSTCPSLNDVVGATEGPVR